MNPQFLQAFKASVHFKLAAVAMIQMIQVASCFNRWRNDQWPARNKSACTSRIFHGFVFMWDPELPTTTGGYVQKMYIASKRDRP